MIEVTSEHSVNQQDTIASFNRWLEQNDHRDVPVDQIERLLFTAYLDGISHGLAKARGIIKS